MTRSQQLPDQLFFKIGEVAEIVGVKPHVLRYWESEFRQLRPMKTRGSHRIYKRRDVEVAVLIRRLLHDEGYTIPGARKRLRELRFGSGDGEATNSEVGATAAAVDSTTLVDVAAPLSAKAELRAVSPAPKTQPGLAAPTAASASKSVSTPGAVRAVTSSAAGSDGQKTSVAGSVAAEPRPALPQTAASAKREANLRAEFLALRAELSQVLKEFDRMAKNDGSSTPKSVRVQQVVLSPVSVHR